MTWCADKAYGDEAPSEDRLERRFAAVCGGSYRLHSLASDIHGGVKGYQPHMWDDPFFETRLRMHCRDRSAGIAALGKGFDKLARSLEACRADRTTGDMDYAYNVARTFADRYVLLARILAAYKKKDKAALLALSGEIATFQKQLKTLAAAFRRMWLSHNKPQGMEGIQAHFGRLDARYTELATRLREYGQGAVKSIPEFDAKCPPG